MDHGKNIKTEQDNSFKYKQKIGIILFFIYCLIYGGFIFINIYNPDLMSINILFDVNLAIIYGFTLIGIAVIMGLVYNIICTNAEKKYNKNGETK